MNQSHHTPGQDRYGHYVLFNAGTDREFRSAMPCSEVANQCASAPDLLTALQDMLQTRGGRCGCSAVRAVCGPLGKCDECRARNVIAKATGGVK